MKKTLFLLATILINIHVISSEKKIDMDALIDKKIKEYLRGYTPAIQLPIYNHIYTSSTAENQNNLSMETVKSNTEEKKDDAYLKMFQNTLKSLHEKKDSLRLSLIEYKWIIAGSCLVSFYVYIWNQINQINKLLNNANSWHLFKEEIPLSRLKNINRADLFKELQMTICKKYINPCQPDSSQKVMIKFLEDISLEKTALEKYINFYQIINNCYASKFFPTFKKIEHIEEAIARINFLIDLYIEFFVIK